MAPEGEVDADGVPSMPTAEGMGLGPGMDEEDIHEFLVMVLEMPAMVYGEHLLRTDAQVRRFSHQVFVYCEKKGIDVSEYLFDEFGLIFSGVVLVQGMRKDHKAYKESKGITKKKKRDIVEDIVPEMVEIEEDPRQTIVSDIYVPPEPVVPDHNTSGGGDALPDIDDSGLAEDAGTIDYSDEEYDEKTVVIGGVCV